MDWEGIKDGAVTAFEYVREYYLYFLIGGTSLLLGAWLF